MISMNCFQPLISYYIFIPSIPIHHTLELRILSTWTFPFQLFSSLFFCQPIHYDVMINHKLLFHHPAGQLLKILKTKYYCNYKNKINCVGKINRENLIPPHVTIGVCWYNSVAGYWKVRPYVCMYVCVWFRQATGRNFNPNGTKFGYNMYF